jgi:hypothetical protein
MPYMDTAQGRGPFNAHTQLSLFLLALNEQALLLSQLQIVKATNYICKRNSKKLFTSDNKVTETGWTNNCLFYSECESTGVE